VGSARAVPIDEHDDVEPIPTAPRPTRLRRAATGLLVGSGIVVAGIALDHALVILAGVLVITATWLLVGFRFRRRGRSADPG
jgi:hypothetical protein